MDTKQLPLRKCVACNGMFEKDKLFRLVRLSDGIHLDLTYKMTKILEKIIIENPTQWLWFQKRWNTAPEQQVHKHHIVKSEVTDNE